MDCQLLARFGLIVRGEVVGGKTGIGHRVRRDWLATSAGLAISFVPALPAWSQEASQPQAAEAAAVQEDDSAQGEDIVVTGTRLSLENALQTKRSSNIIVDSISSEGVGRLPDLNLAESLQRVPGVQINRSAHRRRGTISIRGLPGGFAQTLINGQYLAAPDVSNFSFGTVRSEVFSGIDVIKAQGANNITGGLSGLIDLRTGDPFSGPNLFALSLDGYYEELTGNWSPGGAAVVSHEIVPDVLAVRATLGFKSSDFRIDNFQVNTYDRIAGAGTPDGADDVYRPREVRLPNQRTRSDTISGSFGLEWRATEKLTFELLGFYSKDDSNTTQNQYSISSQTGSIVTALGDPTNEGVFGSTQSHIRIANPQIIVDTRYEEEAYDTQALTGKAAWTDDVWTLSAVLHYTKATRELVATGYQAVQRPGPGAGNGFIAEIDTGAGNIGDLLFDLNKTSSGLVDLEQAFGAPIGPVYREIRGLNNATNSFIGGLRTEAESDRETSFSFDVAREVDFGPVSVVRLGGVYRDKAQSQGQSIGTLYGSQIGNLSNDFYDFSLLANGKSYLGGAGSIDFADYGQLNPKAITAALTPVSGLLPPGANAFIGPDGLTHIVDSTALAAIYTNGQKIYGAYAMADIDQKLTDNIHLRGNFGIRYEKSERSTKPSMQTTALDFSYDNWLPSANLVFEFGENLLLRTSYGHTMRRPQVDAFAVLRSIAVDGTGQLVTVNLGASDLQPFTSENLDVSLEWYNREGSSISVLGFRKKVKDYAGTTRICPEDGGGFGFGPLTMASGTCRTVNATPAQGTLRDVAAGASVNINVTANQTDFTLSGIELSVQQNLSFLPAPFNGFGGQMNYTYVNFSSDGSFRLDGISKNTLNLIMYYETPRFGIRAAYNYRSEYFLGAGGTATGGDRMVKARPQLDLSGSFNVTDKLGLSLEAFNITNENLVEYEGETTRVRNYFHYGRTFTVGARYKF